MTIKEQCEQWKKHLRAKVVVVSRGRIIVYVERVHAAFRPIEVRQYLPDENIGYDTNTVYSTICQRFEFDYIIYQNDVEGMATVIDNFYAHAWEQVAAPNSMPTPANLRQPPTDWVSKIMVEVIDVCTTNLNGLNSSVGVYFEPRGWKNDPISKQLWENYHPVIADLIKEAGWSVKINKGSRQFDEDWCILIIKHPDSSYVYY